MDQPWLGFGRTGRIAVDGVRYRLFRAAVTVAVIAVAVAFLMNILSESLIKRRLAAGARLRLSELRDVHLWAARLTRPSGPEAVLSASESIPRAFLAVLSDADRERFLEHAPIAAEYLAFFDRLEYDDRRTLIHLARGVGIFDALRSPERFESFETRLAQMRAVRFVSTPSEFRLFLDAWPALQAQLRQVMAAEAAAVAALTATRGSRTVLQALADPAGGFAVAARQVGFALDDATVHRVVGQARAVLDRQAVERTLSLLQCRQLLAQHFDLLPADISPAELWRYLETPVHARTFLGAMAPLAAGLQGYAPERLVQLAGARREELALDRRVRLTAGFGDGRLGLGERMGWLLTVSMLVCVIGISNAMLMTVTERFREIATMKCLGALDEFIMLLFVIESCLLGLVGGLIGSLLGDLIGYGRMAAIFGLSAFTAVPPGELLAAMGAAVGVGVVLAAAAAIYPSLKAARLAPMEAMRVE